MVAMQTSQAQGDEEDVDNCAHDALSSPRLAIEHQPSSVELQACPADLAMIRTLFGSRAQTIINALLAWDALLSLVLRA